MSALSAQIITTAEGIKRREAIPRVIPVASPAVGADWSVTIPGGVVWRTQSVVGTLATSATVANRFPVLTVSDGSNTFLRVPPATAETASATFRNTWAKAFGDHIAPSGPAAFIVGLPEIPLFGGCTISSVTQNIDAGDQWSGIVLYVVEIWERSVTVEEQYELAAIADTRGNAYPDLEDNY